MNLFGRLFGLAPAPAPSVAPARTTSVGEFVQAEATEARAQFSVMRIGGTLVQETILAGGTVSNLSKEVGAEEIRIGRHNLKIQGLVDGTWDVRIPPMSPEGALKKATVDAVKAASDRLYYAAAFMNTEIAFTGDAKGSRYDDVRVEWLKVVTQQGLAGTPWLMSRGPWTQVVNKVKDARKPKKKEEPKKEEPKKDKPKRPPAGEAGDMMLAVFDEWSGYTKKERALLLERAKAIVDNA